MQCTFAEVLADMEVWVLVGRLLPVNLAGRSDFLETHDE